MADRMTREKLRDLLSDMECGAGPDGGDIMAACDDLIAQERAEVERLRAELDEMPPFDLGRLAKAMCTHVHGPALCQSCAVAIRPLLSTLAKARTERDEAREQVKRVRELHSPEEDPRRVRDCKGCRTHVTFVPYEDCKTLAALDGTEGGR